MADGSASDLDSLFKPRSVAVIGASNDAEKFGGRAFRYLTEGASVTVYGVNPAQARVLDQISYPSVVSIGATVDLAIIAVPTALVEAALADCVAAQVKAAIILSSGLTADARVRDGLALALDRIGKSGSMRVLGPNCIGVATAPLRMAATWATMWEDGWIEGDGRIAVACQSGAFASYLLSMLMQRHQPVRYWCSTGNESDVELADCVDYYTDDPDVGIILICLEGVKDGPRLRSALKRARELNKMVVALAVSTSDVGKLAAASHTGAVASEDRVLGAVFRRYHVHRARSFEEMVDIATAASIGRIPDGPRLGLVTLSGGAGIMMADRADLVGVDIPALSGAIAGEIRSVSSIATVRNPVDVGLGAGAAGDVRNVAQIVRLIAADDGIDGILVFLTSFFKSAQRMAILRAGLSDLLGHVNDKPIFLSLFADYEDLMSLELMGFPTFIEPTRGIDTFRALVTLGGSHAKVPIDEVVGERIGPRRINQSDIDDVGVLELASKAGIPTVPTKYAPTVRDAVAAAEGYGYPVVLKLSSVGSIHKSDVGGVLTGIRSADELRSGAEQIMASVSMVAPGLESRGFLVQPMVSGVIEIMIGARRDPIFGVFVVLGLGGKLVEILDDVALRLSPVSIEDARSMIAELRGSAALRGARGLAPVDEEFIIRTVVQFSKLADELDGYDALELNPLIVGEVGSGGVAVDARMTFADETIFAGTSGLGNQAKAHLQ